jgi:hypothetical protein
MEYKSPFFFIKKTNLHIYPPCASRCGVGSSFFPPDDRFTTLVYDGLSMANAKLRCPPRPTDRQTDRERRDSIAGCKYGQREKIISTCLAPNFLLS